MPIYASSEFKGIGFNFDPTQQPFFKAIVKENLRLLNTLPTGKALLKAIRDAKPKHRLNGWPSKVNVVLQPPITRTWSTPGLGARSGKITDQGKFDAFQQRPTDANPDLRGQGKLIPGISSKTQVQEDNKAAASDGSGSVAWLFYSNNEILSDSGTWFVPHITMGHELIHCLHALWGEMDTNNRFEEYKTVGIKGFENYTYTENKLRADAGHPKRTKYFSDD